MAVWENADLSFYRSVDDLGEKSSITSINNESLSAQFSKIALLLQIRLVKSPVHNVREHF